jgi:DNA-binding HxlR family transcriptional regulator
LFVRIDAGTKGTSVSPTHREVPVSRYEDVCLIRGDQGRAIRALLDRIADKWTLLIIATLHDGRLRFTQLQRHIPGISQRMLSLTLRNLERDGLVTRTVFAEVPPRVEYELTETANTLIPHAVALANWAVENNPEIDAPRTTYDTNRTAADAKKAAQDINNPATQVNKSAGATSRKQAADH